MEQALHAPNASRPWRRLALSGTAALVVALLPAALGAPCTEGLEVEVSGVCWLSVTQRPCPPQTRAYQGQCLLPVAVPRPPVTSLDGGGGSEPR